LLGLLIAHQCSAPRAWEKSVIDVFAQIATQTGLALNNAQLLTNYAHLQKQAENETEWTKLLTNAVSNIRTSLKHEDILTAAVEEARRAIGTDRVVIYSLDEQLGGKVIAESVTGEWPKTLGATIDDPCFSTRYLKEYQNGRVKAIDDIYAANLTPCYLGQLEPFAVKASLIVPILNQGSLLGLLIAHHCSGPRAWEKSEIDLFAQIATQTGLALNNGELLTEYNRLQEQAETETQWKKLFTDASERIHASLKREDILKTAVEESRQAIGVDRVVIYSLEEESWGKVIAESVVSDWPQALGIRLDDPCFRAHYFEQYQNGRVQAVEDIYAANFTACYLNQLQPLAVKASLNVPILSHGKLLGLLIAHQCSGPRAWEKSEMDLFVQIATQTGLALNNAQLLANAIHLQEQAEAKTQWTKLFTDAVANIRTSLKQQDILTAAVEEARRAIVSDRVLIYSLEEPSWGKVIAESVAPGLPKALGTTIDDPCFKARYFEQYQNGRIQAIENIYAAHLTPCYMGQLETLSVTAGLIVPILNQGKLLGLLIAHQCSGPRVWQEFEIKCFAQIAIHVGFAIKDAQLWQCFTQVSESQQETEALQQQVFTLVKDSETVLETFSNDIKVIRETVADTVNKVRHFSQSSHKISQAVSQISDLTTEMNDKAINITIEAGKTEDVVQGPVVSLAEMVRSLTNQLAQTTGEVQPLIAEIETEANQIVNAIEARKKNVFNESELVEEARQKLNQIATVSAQIGAVVQCAKED
ncbi:MAG: GAF domain-containing protein, partial [Prochloraceae cyanobacterium]